MHFENKLFGNLPASLFKHKQRLLQVSKLTFAIGLCTQECHCWVFKPRFGFLRGPDGRCFFAAWAVSKFVHWG